MFRFIWRQLRDRAGRSVALLAGVLVATTGFVVLTGATTTSRLEATGTVERNTRAAYDILVRPTGTHTALEPERRLVRPNYLSGIYGGITTGQYERVKAIAGVDVAAPIAMLGYSTSYVPVSIDRTDAVCDPRSAVVEGNPGWSERAIWRVFGTAAVADVLYLNTRDRAAELATLRATGWTDAALGRLIGYEGLLLGALSALAGAGLGLGGAAWLVGDLPAALMLVAAAVTPAGVLVTCLAALVPAALLRRLPTARLLAEE